MPFALFGLLIRYRSLTGCVRVRALAGTGAGDAELELRLLRSVLLTIRAAVHPPSHVVPWHPTHRRTWTLVDCSSSRHFGFIVPFLWPYREAQLFLASSGSSARCIFSANHWSYLTASENLRLYGEMLRFNPRAEQETFLGFVPLVLAAVALVTLVPRLKPRGTRIGVWKWTAWPAALAAGHPNHHVDSDCRHHHPVHCAAQRDGVRRLRDQHRRHSDSRAHADAGDGAVPVAYGLLLALSRNARVQSLRAARSPVVLFLAFTVRACRLGCRSGPGSAFTKSSTNMSPASRRPRPSSLCDDRRPLPGITGRIWREPSFHAKSVSPKRTAVAVIASLILLESAAIPMESTARGRRTRRCRRRASIRAPQAPAVYTRLASLPAGTVVTEFPFGDPAWEIRYVYYSAVHWKRISTATAAAFPQRYKVRVARLQRVAEDPDDSWQALARLRHHARGAPSQCFARPDEPMRSRFG